MAILGTEGREVVPEILALGLGAAAYGTAGGIVRALDEAVEGVCGTAGADLDVLAELGGVLAGLGGKVGFSELVASWLVYLHDLRSNRKKRGSSLLTDFAVG